MEISPLTGGPVDYAGGTGPVAQQHRGFYKRMLSLLRESGKETITFTPLHGGATEYTELELERKISELTEE